MATVYECDFNDTDFPTGGSHPAGVAWDYNIDLTSPAGAGLSPLVGSLTSGWNLAGQVGGVAGKITSVASRRAGYKGWRTLLGNGANVQTASPSIEATNLTLRELWLRWYMRCESGMTWDVGAPTYWKLLRFPNGSEGLAFGSYGTAPDGKRAWGINVATPDQGGNTNWASNISWYQSQGNSETGDGLWHCYEIHVKKNSNTTTADGIFEFWFDGVSQCSYSNVSYKSGLSDWGYTGHDNQSSPVGTWALDWADIKMVDSGGPIGPISEGGVALKALSFMEA